MLYAGGGSNDLDHINEISQQAYNAGLSECQNCGRRFLPEKLIIHNRSCRPDNPARRVDDSVNRRNPVLDNSAPLQPTQPAINSDKMAASAPITTHRQTVSRGVGGRPGSSGRGLGARPGSSGRGFGGDQFGGGGVGLPPEDFIPAMMMQCPDCGRSFNEQAYEKHTRICKKVFIDKRKVYDSAEHRAKGCDLEEAPRARKSGLNRGNSTKRIAAVQYSGPGTPVARQSQGQSSFGGQGGNSGATPKWKADSSALRQAMKAARQVSLAQKKAAETGIPLAQLLPPPTAESAAADPIYNSYIQCPTCGRRFNETAGARHIPKCKDIINKPSRLKAHSGAPATTSRRNY